MGRALRQFAGLATRLDFCRTYSAQGQNGEGVMAPTALNLAGAILQFVLAVLEHGTAPVPTVICAALFLDLAFRCPRHESPAVHLWQTIAPVGLMHRVLKSTAQRSKGRPLRLTPPRISGSD